MSFFGKVKGLTLITIGAAAGAGAAYLLDPDRGRSRRAQYADQASAIARRGLRGATSTARGSAIDAVNRTRGMIAEAITPTTTANDQELADRVRSEVIGYVQVPAGRVLVDACDGVVTLRGEVPDHATRTELEQRTRAVAGVLEVTNLTHLPGTIAPNKESAHAATSSTSGERAP